MRYTSVTHSTWEIRSTYFIEIFGGMKLIAEAQIPKFIQGLYPKENIEKCQKEWKKLVYRYERI